MEEPYIEGVAIRGGPESCVGVREDAGEALTRVRVGWLLSREIRVFGVPTLLLQVEGNIAGGVIREPSVDPARSPLCQARVRRSECRNQGA
jgi:RNA-directed DNA polymerase